MHVAYRVFRSSFTSWEGLFAEAAEFATQLGPGRVISISHSEDKNDGVVTVWYWNDVKRRPAVEHAHADIFSE
nr:MAG: hypothetical protein DIU57_21075 [Pseudomonadota bacterium]